jgi:DDE superfamily endonuclease
MFFIGSIDGSHIQIDKPTERHDDYVNRKSYHSMVLQGICNEHKKFIDVFIGYPGSVHDARVFRNSDIHDNMETLCKGIHIF